LIDEALEEHAEVKETIAIIQGMKPTSAKYDATVKKLAKLIDKHVLEERERIFLQARNAPLDLRGMALPLFELKQKLSKKSVPRVKEIA
jgi:hypothetical protein